ncbi:hypothetical protein J6Q66_03725 [bacterium]|nr:hypothetical protein [bacterium]
MQVVEIKNDLAQVRYNAEEHAFSLGDFLVISDSNADILSQIIHLETDEENALCLTKFILNINNDQTTSLYNGYLPSVDSVVSPVSKQELIDFITPIANGVNLGTLVNSNLPVQLSSTILETPLYIQSDYLPACTKLIELLLTQNNIEKNVLLYDLEGTFTTLNAPKYTLGENYKVPLNEFFIDFIYNNDLNELDVSQKALVQDILLEIKDYIKTTDKTYLEFSTLLDVVNEQYNEQPSDALILFRNKLIEYKQLNYFVESEEEFETNNKVLNTNSTLFNAFKLKANWQKALFEFLTSSLSQKTQVIAQISDTSVDELGLNNILVNKNVYPIFITNYSSQYRNLLRSKIPNMIFFQSIDQVADFPLYSNFLNVLFDNNYIIWGEITSYLSILTSFNQNSTPKNVEIKKELEEPTISTEKFVQSISQEDLISEPEISQNEEQIEEVEQIEEITQQEENDELENLIVELDNATENEIIEETVEDNSLEITEAFEEETVEDSVEEIFEEIVEEVGKTQNDEQNDDIFNEIIEEDIIDDDLDLIELEENSFEEPVQEINEEALEEFEENKEENFDDIELPEEENISEIITEENNNFNKLTENETTIQDDLSNEEIEEEIFEELNEDNIEDVVDDIVQEFEEEVVVDETTNNITEENNNEEEIAIAQEEAEEIATEEIEEEQFEDYSTNTLETYEEAEESESIEEPPIEEVYPQEVYEPIEEPKFQMPVYSSEPDEPQEQQLGFVEGNIVYHEKYGRGIIEKVITYGAKTLCSIQFDNIGRRLLDPNLADLKHV